MKHAEKLKHHIQEGNELLSFIQTEIETLKQNYESDVLNRISGWKLDIDDEEFKEFFKKPYLTIPKGGDEWFVVVPSFIPFHVGILDRREGNFNIFIINKFTRWMGDLPEFMQEDIQLPEPKDYKVIDGMFHFDPKLKSEVEKQFSHRLGNIGKRQARIKRGNEFDLIAEIIRDGSLPFVPNPVDEVDLRERVEGSESIITTGKFKFHKDAWDSFMKFGAIGIYWMTGAGKDIFAIHALDSVTVGDLPNLFLAPNRTILQQLEEDYIPKFAPRLAKEIKSGKLILSTYQGAGKFKNQEFGLVIFGECHRLPANTFSALATYKTKYRIGQSASPFREDGRTDLIFAMTGQPVGLDWLAIMNLLGKKYHEVNVHIVKNKTEKFNRAEELYNPKKSTLFFVWQIEDGKRLKNKLGLPFIYGQTKKRMEILKENPSVIVSQVGEMGISLKKLQHIIEVGFHYGSRAKQLQKTGRLFHSASAERHDIIFTEEEYSKYKKRLYSLVEKGFKLNFVGKKMELKIENKIVADKFKGLKKSKILKTTEIPGDKLSFLKHPVVREIIKECLKEPRVSATIVKGSLALLLNSEGITLDMIAKSLGLSGISGVSTSVSALEKHKLIVKSKDNGKLTVKLNDKGIHEIIELQNKRKETQGLIEELFGDE